ncbi:hypothetical protein XELAEV_18011955mg [Xenopus laevis]|uniref:Laminin EGF-like domain-containing protein n=1 Tax=Xenopus laevis TaxID=8355 RepID=A0A974DPD7_XENLA|nr:hypothetical protein XELAEV_18011955mg [Xenopus laevis]
MQMKCCHCDSRQPFTEISHRITNVLSPTGHLRCWQSSNGFSPMELAFSVPLSHSQRIQLKSKYTFPLFSMKLCFSYTMRDIWLSLETNGSHQTTLEWNFDLSDPSSSALCCADLFNDLPWRPADENYPNECRRCNCNNHADKCHFDPAVYEASGRVNGGVCDNCRDGTTGRNCERCQPDYYRNPNRDMSPEMPVFVTCDCYSDGSIDDGSCDNLTGGCNENVGGERCDQCKPGYYLLSASNPQDCTRCTCIPQGSERDQPWDSETGQCKCLPNVVGQQCDQCATHHWNLASGQGCESATGQCLCREGFGVRFCTECPDRMNGNLQTGCRACNCDFQRTLEQGCDKATGRCLCQAGINGARCDSCQRGYSDPFPTCRACHQYFHFYDHEMNVLSSETKSLHNIIAGQGQDSDLGMGPPMAGVEAALQRIQRISTGTPISDNELSHAEIQLSRVRGDEQQLNTDLPDPESFSSLSNNLHSLRTQFNRINVLYQSKKQQHSSSISSDASGIFRAVNSAYQSSLESAKSIAEAEGVVSQSKDSRRVALGLEGKSTELLAELETLKEELSYPNLTPTINRICEGLRINPCTPEECPGPVCQRNNDSLCNVGNKAKDVEDGVDGAIMNLSQAKTALQEAEDKIHGSSSSLQQIQNRIQEIEDILGPAERGLTDVHDQVQQFTAQGEKLHEKTAENQRLANEAHQATQGANGKALEAQQGLETVKMKYTLLKSRLGQSSNLGEQGEKTACIKMEANCFIQETIQMMNKMKGIKTELQEGRQTLLIKFSQLEGLEEEARFIPDIISERALFYATCK